MSGAAVPDAVVAFLVREQLSLTALELYQELLERGKEVPALRLFIDAQVATAPPGSPVRVHTAKSGDGSGPVAVDESEVEQLQAEVRRLHRENSELQQKLQSAPACDAAAAAAAAAASVSGDRKHRDLAREVRTLSERLRRYEAGERAVVQVIADRLPTVITSVGSSRKDCLTHILLTIIENNPDSQVRSSLLYYFAHLFKRPDSEQRRTVAEGLRSLVQRAQDTHVRPEELTAAVRSLSDHRYPEGRVLAAEAAAVLVPLLPAASQSELMCGILRCLRSDSQSVVREAAVVAMSQCLAAASGRGIAEFACASCIGALQDTSSRVQCAALKEAIPALAAAGADAGWLCALVAEPVASALEGADAAAVPSLCAALALVLAHLRPLLLSTVPSGFGSRGEGLDTLLHRASTRKIRGQWAEAEWVLRRLSPCVLRTIETLERGLGDGDEVVSAALSALVALLCAAERRLSPRLREDVLRPDFEDLILSGVVGGGDGQPGAAASPRWGLLPWYLCFALKLTGDDPAPHAQRKLTQCDEESRAVDSDASSAEGEELGSGASPPSMHFAYLEGLRDAASAFLCRCVALAAESDLAATGGTGVVAECARAIAMCMSPSALPQEGPVAKGDGVAVVAVDGMWKCVVERDVVVRQAAGLSLGELLSSGHVPHRLLARRVLPALQTLAEDPDAAVRRAALRPLTVLATLADPVSQSDVLTNIEAALKKGAHDAGETPLERLRVARAWSGVVHRVPPGLAQRCALPSMLQGLRVAAAAAASTPDGAPAGSALRTLVTLLSEQVRMLAQILQQLSDPAGVSLAVCTALRELAAATTDPVMRGPAQAAVRDFESALRTAEAAEGGTADASRPTRFLQHVQQGLHRLTHAGGKEDSGIVRQAPQVEPERRPSATLIHTVSGSAAAPAAEAAHHTEEDGSPADALRPRTSSAAVRLGRTALRRIFGNAQDADV
eukprot:TRINITY_DN11694_c3_g1_i1.p1 TRINITY_DN11694_c3_g1~~TRINITY_DN11694_c3_g1_i1.p1  ORF type:complete len:978 (+),score=304.12 TRINITY_DN11694_c3_g1_i1:62-2935(+)